MSASEDSTRPISVAELLARNGTIGAPQSSGHRRRRRRKGDAVSVAELTSEIPVVRDDAPPDEAAREASQESATEETVPEEAGQAAGEEVGEEAAEAVVDDTVVEAGAEAAGVEQAVIEEVASDAVAEDIAADIPADTPEDIPEDITAEAVADEAVADEAAEVTPAGQDLAQDPDEEPAEQVTAVPAPSGTPPPLSGDPLPSRRRGPERSYDPRPVRRVSGAEQMAYDPVDQSVDLAELVDEHAVGAEELQSYLRASGGPLFSGETVADDLARRGVETEVDDPVAEAVAQARPRGVLRLLWQSFVAVLQSLLAVAFGAGLFIAFGELWQWNSLVALALSVLVILSLVIAVRVVRKTEDIASTLIAVAVGALVTLGPLALMQSI